MLILPKSIAQAAGWHIDVRLESGRANALAKVVLAALGPDASRDTHEGVMAEAAVKQVFGNYARSVAISSTKSMIGHLLGASGGIELIVCALTVKHNVIHPTINLTKPDPACDLDYVPNQPRETRVKRAISNSFGFGGHNCCLAVGAV